MGLPCSLVFCCVRSGWNCSFYTIEYHGLYVLACLKCVLTMELNKEHLKKNPGGGEIFRTRPDRPWGPPSLLYNGYRVFSGVKGPERGADHPPPSSAEVENSRAIHLLPSRSLVACYSVNFTLYCIQKLIFSQTYPNFRHSIVFGRYPGFARLPYW
jgi:hypothetical protein